MKKITIGLFNDSFPPMVDGVGMVVDNYARRLSKIANVYVIVPKYKEYFDDSTLPYKVIRCRSIKVPFIDYSLPIPRFDRKLKKKIKNIKFDIIHIHSPFTIGKLGIRIGKKLNIPIIGTMHSQYKQDFIRAVKNKFIANILTWKIVRVFNKCTKCFAVNSGMAKLYYEDYGVKELPGVLSNATEMELVKNKKKSIERINLLHNLNKNDKVFLFVGRINKLKNIFFIVDCLRLLNYRKLDFKYKMLFVGDGQDLIELEDYIRKRDMTDNIILCGSVKDRSLLRDYYARSDIFLFPSLYDASSIVQIEAASQKVPTIFLKGSKTSSDITHGVNGMIAKNKREFGEMIYELMTDNDLYQKISEGCYKDVYKSWDKVVEEVYKKYLEFIKE
jgi:glycosyltransferase involved in cell wall biosynthesis